MNAELAEIVRFIVYERPFRLDKDRYHLAVIKLYKRETVVVSGLAAHDLFIGVIAHLNINVRIVKPVQHLCDNFRISCLVFVLFGFLHAREIFLQKKGIVDLFPARKAVLLFHCLKHLCKALRIAHSRVVVNEPGNGIHQEQKTDCNGSQYCCYRFKRNGELLLAGQQIDERQERERIKIREAQK